MKQALYDPRFRTYLLGKLFPRSYRQVERAEFAHRHAGENFLLTGGGGSIGSAMAEAIPSLRPRKLVVVDSWEANSHRIRTVLSSGPGRERPVPILGSVADQRQPREIFETPRYQDHFSSGGFQARAAMLMMISTGRAVNRLSTMRTSNFVAEPVLLTMGGSTTRMSSILPGNVLASEGSVVPRFVEQIARRGPVTETYPRAEPYVLTPDRTVNPIFQAATCPADNGIAVPQTGEPTLAVDLAHYLTRRLSTDGRLAAPGLRPGDKLQEKFMSTGESVWVAPAGGIQRMRSPHVSEIELASGLSELRTLVPEYQPSTYLLQQAAAPVAS